MDKHNSTISINIPNPVVGIEKLKSHILAFALEMYNGPIRQRTSPMKKFLSNIKNPFKNFNTPNFKFPKPNKKLFVRLALPVFVVLIFVFGAVSLIRNFNTTSANPNSGVDVDVVLPDAVSKQEINRKFIFPIRDEEGKEVGNFDYIIQNAELRKQIIVKGQRATSVSGRVFLIVNLKVTNNLSQEMELPSRGYLRVVVGNNEAELLAADIHSDPVEVLGKSTKYTRLGLAINEEDAEKTIKLLVGEIEGEKQTVELNFK